MPQYTGKQHGAWAGRGHTWSFECVLCAYCIQQKSLMKAKIVSRFNLKISKTFHCQN